MSITIEQAHQTAQAIHQQIHQAVVGQNAVIEQILLALFAGGHVLIEGAPGLGKTLLVRALSHCISGQFSRIQFTPDLMPTDVTGHALFDLKTEQFEIRKGPVFTNLLLADEINRAPAKTQAALLEVMQEAQVTIEGKPFQLSPPFMVLATQNPIEQEGTYPLPEAQLDRFLLKVKIDYPDKNEENQLVANITQGQIGDNLNVSQLEVITQADTIIAIQTATANLQVDQQVIDYAVNIVRTTREWSGIAVGSGPRGSIGLIRVARAKALLAGREFVIPDDIKQVATSVLRHRIILSAELEIEGHHSDFVLEQILEKVPAPRM